MPTINVNGVNLYYEIAGDGPETIVFAHGLLWRGKMFEAQVNFLKDTYRCITFDFRGQGQTEVTASGYDMDTLAEDAATLIEALHCTPCHFAGLSMGGFIAMRLAIRRPEHLKSIILLNTSAEPEPTENVGRYRLLNFIARWFGLGLVANQIMPIMFGKKFLADPQRTALRETWRRHMVNNHHLGISRAVTGVIEREGVYDQLDQIDLPTLIIAGEDDTATVPAKARRIQERITSAKLVMIPDAGHTSTVEEPEAVNVALKDFLSQVA